MKLGIDLKSPDFRALRFYLDLTLVTQILFPIFMFLLFLILPLASVLYVATQYNPLDVISDPMYVSLTPHGELVEVRTKLCLLYTSPSPRDGLLSRMPSSA